MMERLIRLRNTLIVTAVFAGLFGGGFFLIRDSLSIELTPEELARFRYAIAGTFSTDEGNNTTTTVLGATILTATSERADHDAGRLIDEYHGPNFEGWRSMDVSFPQEIIVQLTDRVIVDKVIVTNHPTEPPSSYVKDFELLLSDESPRGPWESVGQWTAGQRPGIQRFTFGATLARFALLRVLSNYGSREYTSLTSFEVYVSLKGPLRPSVNNMDADDTR